MDNKFDFVCKQLQQFGYKYTLKKDSLLLVEQLLQDLIKTTEHLKKYKQLAQEVIEERDSLAVGAEPYKNDNAKLLKECNELHLKLMQIRENSESQNKALQKQINLLGRDKADFLIIHKAQEEHIRDLELQLARKIDRAVSFEIRKISNKKKVPISSIVLRNKSDNTKLNHDIYSTTSLADTKISNMTTEVNKLKDQLLELAEINECLCEKLKNREIEICRLTTLMENHSKYEADMFYSELDSKFKKLQNDMNYMQKHKLELELQLKDARNKQHEAMKHALKLAEQNSKLEKELKDIDRMALEVEADCNVSAKRHVEKLNRLQEKLHSCESKVQFYEVETSTLQREKKLLVADVDALRAENSKLKSHIETSNRDFKTLTEKVENFKIIENDLNKEIDRLMSANMEERNKVSDLSEKLKRCMDRIEKSGTDINQRSLNPSARTSVIDQHNQGTLKSLTKSSLIEQGKVTKSPTITKICNPEECFKSLKSLIDKELDERFPNKINSLERLTKERDFYIQEFKNLIADFKNTYLNTDISNLKKQLDEKDRILRNLEEENKLLSSEKQKLMYRLDSIRNQVDDSDQFYLKTSLKRLERDKEMLRAEIGHLEEERNLSARQYKDSHESQNSEINKYVIMIAELEAKVNRLEQENRNLLKDKCFYNTKLSNLEFENNSAKDEFKKLQSELLQQKTSYTQLRVLHEQTDHTLADYQRQITDLQCELMKYQDKNTESDSHRSSLLKEIEMLKTECVRLKKHMCEMEVEKDMLIMKLDDKTEKIAEYEKDIQQRDSKIRQFENNISDLTCKLNAKSDEIMLKGTSVRQINSELSHVRAELSNANKTKEALTIENRRLQSDLATNTVSSRSCQNELDIARRQIEDLKRQLQHYVAEVKRFEDLMAQKEVERGEMLDQFRSLSQEATILETNNHSLENETVQTKIQLSVALDHATDLEKHVDEQTTLVRIYERQIRDLTSQIASLEVQIQELIRYKERVCKCNLDDADLEEL